MRSLTIAEDAKKTCVGLNDEVGLRCDAKPNSKLLKDVVLTQLRNSMFLPFVVLQQMHLSAEERGVLALH